MRRSECTGLRNAAHYDTDDGDEVAAVAHGLWKRFIVGCGVPLAGRVLGVC